MAPREAKRTGRRWREHTVPRIIRRDGAICHLCGQQGADTADHITPAAHGGTDHPNNLRAAHIRCNKIRGTRDIELVRTELAAELTRLEPSTTGWEW